MPVYLDDKRLVKQLLGGDQRAFDRFFEENFARLYRFAIARLSDDPEGAREVAQITLIQAVRKLHTFRAESALFTWLCAICRNEISDWLRRQGRYREHIVLVEDYPEVRAAVDSLRVSSEDSPERLLINASRSSVKLKKDTTKKHYFPEKNGRQENMGLPRPASVAGAAKVRDTGEYVLKSVS